MKSYNISLLIKTLKAIRTMAFDKIETLQDPIIETEKQMHDEFKKKIKLCDEAISSINNMSIKQLVK